MASNICSHLKKISEQQNDEENSGLSLVPAQDDDDDAVFSLAEQLPAEMFNQIFQNVDKKSKSLKNYRLVCRTWRNTIDNNPKLFKLLIFTIMDIKQFLDTSLPSKVKSIRFIQPLEGSEEDLEDFFIKIGSTVEEVFFNFGADINGSSNSEMMKRMELHKLIFSSPTPIEQFYENLLRLIHLDKCLDFVSKIWFTAEHAFLHFAGESKAKKVEKRKLMFAMMMRYCTRLTSLTITNEDDNNYEFIKDCTEDSRNSVALSMIQSLTVNARSKYLEDLKKFIFSLPNLRHIDLNCDELLTDVGENLIQYGDYDGDFIRAAMEIHDMILQHLERYNGKLQEVSLEKSRELDDRTLMKLLLSVGKMYPKTKIKCRVDLNCLIDLENTEDIQVNENSCRPIQAGILAFYFPDDEAMNTDRIGFCSNLNSLEIFTNAWPLLAPNKLAFLQELTKLRELKIKGIDSTHQNEESTILNAINSFACEFPSAVSLDLDGDGLGVNYVPFQDCFPNITKLYIRNLTCNINVDFLYNLTNLDQLKCLKLQNITRLTDEHFTQIYEFSDDSKVYNLPAIAGIKSLRHLHIIKCDQLTDKCLINGLALCTKLDKITLWQYKKNGKITKPGFKYLQQARNFIVDDFAPTDKKYLENGLIDCPRRGFEFKKFSLLQQQCRSPLSRSSNKLKRVLGYFMGTRYDFGAIVMLIMALLYFVVY